MMSLSGLCMESLIVFWISRVQRMRKEGNQELAWIAMSKRDSAPPTLPIGSSSLATYGLADRDVSDR